MRSRNRNSPTESSQRVPLGHHVARRARDFDSREDRQLLQFLLAQAEQLGGVSTLAKEIVKIFRDRMGSRSMLENPDLEYFEGDLFRRISDECGFAQPNTAWAIRQCLAAAKERDLFRLILPDDMRRDNGEIELLEFQLKNAKDRGPSKYYWDECLKRASEDLEGFLRRLLIGPDFDSVEQECFEFHPIHDFKSVLSGYMDSVHLREKESMPVTTIGESIFDSLEFAFDSGGLVWIEGIERIGKTEAAKHWYRQNMHRARYVSLECGQTEGEFYRSICDGLFAGYTDTIQMAVLKTRIKDILKQGDILLIVDEAHWAMGNPKLMPKRVAWILTSLVNNGVPVALISTPQFSESVQQNSRASGWRANQLIGRVQHYERLPDEVTHDDLLAVARHHLPEGDQDSWEFLAAYAGMSQSYLQGIKRIVSQARWQTRKNKEAVIDFDLLESLAGTSLRESEEGLEAALTGTKIRPRKAPAQPVQTPCRQDASGETPLIVHSFSELPERVANRGVSRLTGLTVSERPDR